MPLFLETEQAFARARRLGAKVRLQTSGSSFLGLNFQNSRPFNASTKLEGPELIGKLTPKVQSANIPLWGAGTNFKAHS